MFLARERSQFYGFCCCGWFESLPSDFAIRWSAVVGYSVKVRAREDGVARFAVSVPCGGPGGGVRLGPVSRGSRLGLVRR